MCTVLVGTDRVHRTPGQSGDWVLVPTLKGAHYEPRGKGAEQAAIAIFAARGISSSSFANCCCVCSALSSDL